LVAFIFLASLFKWSQKEKEKCHQSNNAAATDASPIINVSSHESGSLLGLFNE
jgi:hypothetical protein